ncbi:MAG TPA: methyltransferase domain-containing protein [Rhodanobacteraceae bacterium]|nr:methyltransferase domain-containing protein [Rhodanobacteraceae bacterium]
MTVPFPSFASAPLQGLLASESRLLGSEMLQVGGCFALLMDVPGMPALASPLRSTLRLRVSPDGCFSGDARGHVGALPLADDSVNLVVLRHAIEYARDPAAMAAEVLRVLAPQGCLLVAGLQPWSLWRPWLWRLQADDAARLQPLAAGRWRPWLWAHRSDLCAVRRFGPSFPGSAGADLDQPGLIPAGYLLVVRKRRNPPMAARITRRQRLPVRGALAGPARRECA